MPTPQPQLPALDSIAVMLEIRGQVQGVGYRLAMLARARELQLQGWVRNRRSGDVQALVQGPRQAVDVLLAWCHDGPAPARVTSVQIKPQALDTQLVAPFVCGETVN